MTVTVRKAELNKKISPHFKEYEFACKCCGMIKYFPDLILKLEDLRHVLGDKPVIVNSGYRCPKHNANVGGVSDSLHMLGMAADIRVPGISIFDVAQKAKEVGFNGIGVYKKDGFVHVDLRAKSWYQVM